LIYNTSQYKAQEMPRLRKKEHTHHHSFIQSEQNHSIWIGIKSTINNVHHSFNQQSTKAYRSPARFREGESFDSSRRVSERERRATWSDHARAREKESSAVAVEIREGGRKLRQQWETVALLFFGISPRRVLFYLSLYKFVKFLYYP
jgi:hypothetical protein